VEKSDMLLRFTERSFYGEKHILRSILEKRYQTRINIANASSFAIDWLAGKLSERYHNKLNSSLQGFEVEEPVNLGLNFLLPSNDENS
jgi:hypothetical protein